MISDTMLILKYAGFGLLGSLVVLLVMSLALRLYDEYTLWKARRRKSPDTLTRNWLQTYSDKIERGEL